MDLDPDRLNEVLDLQTKSEDLLRIYCDIL